MTERTGESFRKTVSMIITAVFVAATIAMLVLSLVMRAELTEKTGDIENLAAELNELEAEKRRLTIELETKTDMGEIEDYARNVLGMQTPYPWQRQSICTEADGRYESYPVKNDTVTDKTADWISSLTEYFGLG